MRTYDCDPTLTDTQVLEFCKQGFLVLEGVVPDEINRRMCEYVDAHKDHPIISIKSKSNERRRGYEVRLPQEDWFVENVILNPQAAGAVRSLLGKNFGLPVLPNNHRVECPAPAQVWHRDGGSRYGPELNHLQVFYYPQDTPVELGPTEVVPGSHFFFAVQSWMSHYGHIRGAVKTAAPAGSIFITVYCIWHRRSASTAHGIRNMLKYCYWRTTPPTRDWIIEPDFDLRTAPYSVDGTSHHAPRQQHRDWYDAAEMFFWVCGKASEFPAFLGGGKWPMGYSPSRMPEGFHKFPADGEIAPDGDLPYY